MELIYAVKYFDLANAITGFVVVQMITFLVALGTSTVFANNVCSAPGYKIVFSVMLLATALYVAAVIACGLVESRLAASAEYDSSCLILWTTTARVAAIVVISGFGLFNVRRIAQRVT